MGLILQLKKCCPKGESCCSVITDGEPEVHPLLTCEKQHLRLRAACIQVPTKQNLQEALSDPHKAGGGEACCEKSMTSANCAASVHEQEGGGAAAVCSRTVHGRYSAYSASTFQAKDLMVRETIFCMDMLSHHSSTHFRVLLYSQCLDRTLKDVVHGWLQLANMSTESSLVPCKI